MKILLVLPSDSQVLSLDLMDSCLWDLDPWPRIGRTYLGFSQALTWYVECSPWCGLSPSRSLACWIHFQALHTCLGSWKPFMGLQTKLPGNVHIPECCWDSKSAVFSASFSVFSFCLSFSVLPLSCLCLWLFLYEALLWRENLHQKGKKACGCSAVRMVGKDIRKGRKLELNGGSLAGHTLYAAKMEYKRGEICFKSSVICYTWKVYSLQLIDSSGPWPFPRTHLWSLPSFLSGSW